MLIGMIRSCHVLLTFDATLALSFHRADNIDVHFEYITGWQHLNLELDLDLKSIDLKYLVWVFLNKEGFEIHHLKFHCLDT